MRPVYKELQERNKTHASTESAQMLGSCHNISYIYFTSFVLYCQFECRAYGSQIFSKTGLNIFVHLHNKDIEMFEMMKSMFT
jgi:hypothetical protein